MTINNNGTLFVCWSDKVSKDYAWKAATAILAEEGIDKDAYGVTFNKDECAIEFEDYPETWLEDTLNRVQKAIGPNVWLEGNLEHWGTTTDGSTSQGTAPSPETGRRRTCTTPTTGR